MTSSTSTGRCPSCMTPPPSSDGSRADPGSACGPSDGPPAGGRFALDAEPSDGLGEGRRILEAPAIGLPTIGSPDLRVVAGADDNGVGPEPGHLPEIARDEDPALAVERRLDRAGEDEPREATGVLVGDRERRHLVGERVPASPGVDRQAGVEPARDDEARLQLGAEPRRDGEPSLVVHRVPVLAGEHLTGCPHFGSDAWPWAASGRTGEVTWLPTLNHFTPLQGIIAPGRTPSMGKIGLATARSRGARNRYGRVRSVGNADDWRRVSAGVPHGCFHVAR